MNVCDLSTYSALYLWPRAGMLKVQGLMPARCGMFDTPGVPHAHQLAAYLDPEEVRQGFGV